MAGIKRWDDLAPRSLFSLFGGGPSADLYPIYLDVLIELFRTSAGADGLRYDLARNRVEDILALYGLKEILPDSQFDDYEDNDEEIKTSQAATILRRLQKSGWIRRETDRLRGEDVVRFPQIAFRLLPVLIEISEEKEIEYDAMLLTILDQLTQTRISKRRSIVYARQTMMELLDGVQGLLQQFASLRPEIESIDTLGLAEWTSQFNESNLKKSYDNLRVRNSVDRWYNEIVEGVHELQDQKMEIAQLSLKISDHTFDLPSLSHVREVADEMGDHLHVIESSMDRLDHMLIDLDQRVSQFSNTLVRRVQVALSSRIAEEVLKSCDDVFEILRILPQQRGRGDVYFEKGINIVPRAQMIHPRMVVLRSAQANEREKNIDKIESGTKIDLEYSPELLKMMKDKANSELGPRAVEAHFEDVFGIDEEKFVSELIGTTVDDSHWLVRLLDYIGLTGGFGFEIIWPHQGDWLETLEITQNEFLRVRNVLIRKKYSSKRSGRSDYV